jgi:tRNA(Ile)-lysidine synthase
MPAAMSSIAANLLHALPRAGTTRYWVAYSGGLDSHVLLHALHGLIAAHPELTLGAVHVHHGLRPAADQWAAHCMAVCAALGVSCQVLHVQARPAAGESPEDAARRARYQALQGVMGAGDCLLTAHHQDDQAETLLLQLLRGSGVAGLAGMPACAPFGAGLLARPLLSCSRAELHDYAEAHGLKWVEDDSNAETGYDRNYLRHEILPRLSARWPATAAALTRSAGHCAAATDLLQVLATQDLAGLRGAEPGTLRIDRLQALDAARQDNALRAWLRALDLPTPSTAHLRQVRGALLTAAQDAMPCVRWPGAELRRYRGLLHAMTPLPAHDAGQVLAWDMQQPLALPGNAGCLQVALSTGHGLDAALRGQRISVRFRRGGEICKPVGRGHHHDLRKLFQEAGVPPWRRERIPLLYVDGSLAAVVGFWVCEPYQATAQAPGLVVEWAVASKL